MAPVHIFEYMCNTFQEVNGHVGRENDWWCWKKGHVVRTGQEQYDIFANDKKKNDVQCKETYKMTYNSSVTVDLVLETSYWLV